MQMTWGVVVGHEPMPPARWLGFSLIWLSLAVFSGDALLREPVKPIPGSVDLIEPESSSR